MPPVFMFWLSASVVGWNAFVLGGVHALCLGLGVICLLSFAVDIVKEHIESFFEPIEAEA